MLIKKWGLDAICLTHSGLWDRQCESLFYFFFFSLFFFFFFLDREREREKQTVTFFFSLEKYFMINR